MKKPKRKTTKPKGPKDEWTTTPLEGGSGKGPFPPDHSDLQRRIKENPGAVAAEAKHRLHEVQAGYRRDLYEVLAMALGIGRHYYNNYKAWRPFFNQPFFQTGKNKPKARSHHEHALRHTMNYVFDAKSKQARSRTGKYAAALHEYMILGVPVHLVADEIEKDGGIEKLYEAYLEREAHKPKKGRKQARSEEDYAATTQYCNLDGDKVGAQNDMTFGDLEDGGEPAEDEGNDPDRESSEGEEEEDPLDIYRAIDGALVAGLKRGYDPKGRPTIELETSDADEKDRFLDLRKGRSAWVRVTSLGRSKDGWRRLKVDTTVWNRRRRRR
jgi:hypothetical protein